MQLHKRNTIMIILIINVILTCSSSFAQKRSRGSSASSSSSSRPYNFSYDLGLSSGTYGGYSYTEINFGLNWYLQNFMNFRNSLFSRFGDKVENSGGLDSSLRFELRDREGNFGYHLFAGPGYRFSSKTASAVFAEAGATLRMYSFSFGLGMKHLQYNSPGTDSAGSTLPKGDTSVFIILAAGGGF